MKFVSLSLLVVLTAACAHKPSPYDDYRVGYGFMDSHDYYLERKMTRAPASVSYARPVCEVDRVISKGGMRIGNEWPSTPLHFEVDQDVIDLNKKGKLFFMAIKNSEDVICQSRKTAEWTTPVRGNDTMYIPLNRWGRFSCKLQGAMSEKKLGVKIIERTYRYCENNRIPASALPFTRLQFTKDIHHGVYTISDDSE